LFASESVPTKADILCMSKGITGGTMALGATACTREIFDAFLSDDRRRTFFHGHSYTANPIACAAGLASLDLLQKKTCIEQIQAITKKNKNFLNDRLLHAGAEMVLNPRTVGTILAFELTNGQHDYISRIGGFIRQKAMQEGIY